MVQSGRGGRRDCRVEGGVALQSGPHAEKDLILLRAPKGAKGNSTVSEWRPESESGIPRNPSCREGLSRARKGHGAENSWKCRLQA